MDDAASLVDNPIPGLDPALSTSLFGPRVITLVEFGTAAADSLSSEERSTLDRRFRDYLAVTHDWRTYKFSLAASHYVGVIQIGALRIRIEPKTPASNFFYMLTYAHKLKIDWNDETRLDSVDEILELIVNKFVAQVEHLLRRGIYRAYRSEDDERAFLRGRLLIAEQLRHEVSAPGRFAQKLHEYTSDIAENRILLWTLHRLSRLPWRDRLLNRRMRRLEGHLDEVSLVPATDADFDGLVYTRLNDTYRGPHRLARLLLQMRSIEGSEGKHHFSGWLLDMNKLFEQFVGIYLQDYVGLGPFRTLTVHLQNKLELGVNYSEAAYPDIVVRQGSKAYAVIDTKHKVLRTVPEEGDRRQLLEYANNLELNDGYLIYSSSAGAAPLKPRLEYRGGWRFALHSVVWPLDGSLSEFRMQCQETAEHVLGRIAQQRDSPPVT